MGGGVRDARAEGGGGVGGRVVRRVDEGRWEHSGSAWGWGEGRVVAEGGDIHAYILRVIGTLMCFRSSAVYWLKLPVSFLALALLTSSDSCFLGVSFSPSLASCVCSARTDTYRTAL